MLQRPYAEDCAALFLHTQPAVLKPHRPVIQGICLSEGETVDFDGYYNLFPLKQYRDFTTCTSPTLTITAEGAGSISVVACKADGSRETVLTEDFCCPTTETLTLCPILPDDTAAFYWSCTASKETLLLDAVCAFAEPPTREIRLAVGICTYQREAFVLRNVQELIQQTIPCHVLIADNGNTLQDRLPKSEHITLLPNRNTGGSGGFARVMQAVLSQGDAFTHLLLMDDDVTFHPVMLQKLVHFLSYCREEFWGMTVAGAMCLLDAPWQQFEAGAKFLDGGVLQGLQMGIDLRELSGCLQNITAPQEADYASWWCCCMAVERIRAARLPLPLFFKMDDVEYALRMGVQTVALPGVCVAHEAFEKKYHPALDYYITRNTLITCAVHHRAYGAFGRIRQLFGAVLRQILLQRYDGAALILRAYADFLRADTLLKDPAPDKHHRAIRSALPAMEAADPALQAAPANHVSRVMRILTLGGLLMPASRAEVVVDMQRASTADAFGAKRLVHLNPLSHTCYRTTLSRKRAWCLFWRTVAMAWRLLIGYAGACRKLETQLTYLRGEHFWGQYNKSL